MKTKYKIEYAIGAARNPVRLNGRRRPIARSDEGGHQSVSIWNMLTAKFAVLMAIAGEQEFGRSEKV
jgi:hypothetical protein